MVAQAGGFMGLASCTDQGDRRHGGLVNVEELGAGMTEAVV